MGCPNCGWSEKTVGDAVSTFCTSYAKDKGFTGHRIVLDGHKQNGRVEFKKGDKVVHTIKIKFMLNTVYNMYSVVKNVVAMDNEYIRVSKKIN